MNTLYRILIGAAVFLCSAAKAQPAEPSKGGSVFSPPAIEDNAQVEITDYRGFATLDSTYRNGLFSVKLQVRNRSDSVQQRFLVLKQPIYAHIEVHAEVLDTAGEKVLDLNSGVQRIQGGGDSRFELDGRIEQVSRWSDETPSLYQVNIRLKERGGRTLKTISYTTGFRKVEQGDTGLLLNGEPFEPRVVVPDQPVNGEKEVQQILEIVRQGNFNAIALTPPVDTSWYKLCDRYGIYIMEDVSESSPDTSIAGIHHPAVIMWMTGGSTAADTPAYETAKDLGAGRSLLDKRVLAGAGVFPELPATPEREPFPGYFDQKYRQQPFTFELEDPLKGMVKIENRYLSENLDNYELRWNVTENGQTVKEGKVDKLEVLPGQVRSLTLGSPARFREGNDYFLNLSVHTRQAGPLIPAGFEIAGEQFNLSPYRYKQDYHAGRGGIRVADEPGSIHLSGYDFRLSFDKHTGTITSYIYKGKRLIRGGPDVNFLLTSAGEEESIVQKARVVDTKVTEDVNGNYFVSFGKELLSGDARFFQKFRIDGDGGILVENSLVKLDGEHPDLLRLGTHFRLPDDYKTVKWYGKGPYESFPGQQKGAARVGVHQGAIRELNGNKAQVRWIELKQADGSGILVRGEDIFLPMNLEDTGGEDVILDVDFKQSPVPFKSYHYTYRIIPISSKQRQ